jgi:hypothetical protein
MSRFIQYDKTNTYLENISQAKIQRQNRLNEEMDQIKIDKIEIDKIKEQYELEQKLEKEKKDFLKRKKYEEYMNYMKNKQEKNYDNNERINIKLGGEDRKIKKIKYNEQMDNLCLNPTKNNNSNIYEQNREFYNYSQDGRNYQRGYSHGYNILTGEIFQPQNNNNININKDSSKDKLEKEKEREYLDYMEMLRKKEMEKNNKIEYNNKEHKLDYDSIPYEEISNQNFKAEIEIPEQHTSDNQFKYNENIEPPKKSYHIIQQENTNQNSNILSLYEINSKENEKNINKSLPISYERRKNQILDTSNNEYVLNKKKNMTSYDDIYKGKEYIINQKERNDRNRKIEKQKEYAKILEGQINSKNIYFETIRNLSKNSEPERELYNNSNILFGSMKPYNVRNNKLKEIPKDPYSNKNFDLNKNNSHLISNPITNPGYRNNYERKRMSERLQNNGTNIIDK